MPLPTLTFGLGHTEGTTSGRLLFLSVEIHVIDEFLALFASNMSCDTGDEEGRTKNTLQQVRARIPQDLERQTVDLKNGFYSENAWWAARVLREMVNQVLKPRDAIT